MRGKISDDLCGTLIKEENEKKYIKIKNVNIVVIQNLRSPVYENPGSRLRKKLETCDAPHYV